MVRGPAAVLIGVALAWAYFLAPEALPAIHPAETSRIVAGVAGALLVAALAVSVAALGRTPFVVPVVLLGAGLVAAGLDAADAGAAATVPETVAYACVGVLFGILLDTPALVLALPLFVAGIDAISVIGGPSHSLAQGATQAGDPLSLELPDWHIGLATLRLGVADVVFIGIYATYARRLGLRVVATNAGLALALVAGVVLAVKVSSPIPQLPLLALGFLVPNLDLIVAAVRRGRFG